uniref:SWIM-type domain-containing protein n=1 Tax=Arundo donax TaxID=35708 RepID=A0A0A9D9J3_ARUDO
MRHLWKNMKKHYGPLFAQNMWPAAKSYTVDKFNYHMGKIEEKCPDAITYLDENHPYLWSRSKFSENCKVDYINNNLSESFNKWVMKMKDLQIVDMHDKIRQMIISMFVLRGRIARKMEGKIIPSISKALKAQSKAIKDHEVLRVGDDTAEVFASTSSGLLWRHAVNLKNKTCSCRAWQVTEKPCNHALAFISRLRDVEIDDYVHEYFSIERFIKTYAGVFHPMTSKHQWP